LQALLVGQTRPTVVIVGCGTVGTAMAKLLGCAGYPIAAVVTGHIETARRAAQATGADHYSDRAWEVTLRGEVVFIATPDDLIASVCSQIAEHEGFRKDAVVIHCSGALSSQILAPARDCSAHAATLHPLQSFASVDQAVSLVPGSFCAVEGDEAALPVVRQMVEDVGGILLEITPGKKTLYHAAAVAASNYLVTLMGLAIELNTAAGLPEDTSFDALLPLVKGTLSNVSVQGVPGALTGPIARGDVATVSAHIQAIEKDAPQFLALYKCLGRYTVDFARAKRSIGAETAERLLELLRS
jgi:predicted short-subunit dehydrogenase-like oxidoreductase (DUF2520 family)